jgi:serine protease inhibitor
MSFWARLRQKNAQPPAARTQVPEVDSWISGAEVAQSLHAFGLTLLQQEVSQRPKQNVFISPLSVFLALAMTETGAGGETKSAMRRALALPADVSPEDVNKSTVRLMKKLRAWRGAELTIANALWVDVRATIAPEFTRVCEEVYEAAVRALDLNEPSAAMAINQWVAEKTRGKIPDMVTPEAIADLPAVITNAIYFKGRFRDPFNKKATEPKPFHLANGGEKLVPMMRQRGLDRAYQFGKRFEAAVLGYEGSAINLYMLLPAKGVSPEEVLTKESLADLFVQQEPVELDLSMPRFTMDFTSRLNAPLTRMGMGIAFQYPGADFTPLGSPLIFIGQVIHKTRLEVDEEGTVAAAASAVRMEMASAAPRIPKVRTLVFDRPFAVLLRDATSGADLFAGVVYDPQG